MGRTSLVLIAFGVISVLLTALAAWLAMHRPDLEHLDVETRSRLAADYSVDLIARRIEPLNPNIVRAAANDEAELTREQPADSTPRRVEQADVTPVATALPTSTPRPSPTVRGTATGTPPPGTTATAKPGEPTATLRPGETPQPSKTPDTNVTPKATPTRPTGTIDVPTVGVPTATLTTLPTLVPTLLPTSTPTPVPPTKTPAPPTSTPTRTPTPLPTATLTPTPTPTTILGGILNALSCTLLGTIGSLPGGGQTSITFVNESEQTVKIYELPTLILGQPVLRATIADGQQYTKSTQAGFAFKVTDLDDNCLGVYRAQAGGGTAIID
ncbi:MAG TPA: hypothetical protein VI876_03680 [Dehalococcoidia bacterium]|nr:hypothetical protein [Dehalococcoidia bacterium]